MLVGKLFGLFILSMFLTPVCASAAPSCRSLFKERSSGGLAVRVAPGVLMKRLALKHELIGQRDQRLAKRGYLLDDGGLCAVTAAAAGLRAIGESGSTPAARALKNSVRVIDSLLSRAERAGADGRKGLPFGLLARALDDLFLELDADYLVDRRPVSLAAPLNEGLLESSLSQAVVLVAVHGGNREAHALALAAIYPSRHELEFIDPENPNRIRSSRYESTVDAESGGSTLKLLDYAIDASGTPATLYDFIAIHH